MSTVIDVVRPAPRQITIHRPARPYMYMQRDYGPQGPIGATGPQGPAGVRTGPLASRPAAPSEPLVYVAVDADDPVSIWDGTSWSTIHVAPATIEKVWASAGVSGLGHVRISGSNWGSAPENTLSVVDGRLRVTSDATQTDGNRREVWTIDGTEDWVDSEIRSIWYGPSTSGSAVVQPGHVHRTTATGGVIVDFDIITMGIVHNQVWGWDGTNLNTLTSDTTGAVPGNTAFITGYSVIGGNLIIFCDEFQALRTTAVVVSGTGVIDGTYSGAGILRQGVTAAGVYGSAIVKMSSGMANKAYTPITGMVQASTANAKAFPVAVASRLVGDRCYAKTWTPGTVEPPWSSAELTLRSGMSWSSDFTSDVNLPTSGGCGLMTNHLNAGEYTEFGDVTVRRL